MPTGDRPEFSLHFLERPAGHGMIMNFLQLPLKKALPPSPQGAYMVPAPAHPPSLPPYHALGHALEHRHHLRPRHGGLGARVQQVVQRPPRAVLGEQGQVGRLGARGQHAQDVRVGRDERHGLHLAAELQDQLGHVGAARVGQLDRDRQAVPEPVVDLGAAREGGALGFEPEPVVDLGAAREGGALGFEPEPVVDLNINLYS